MSLFPEHSSPILVIAKSARLLTDYLTATGHQVIAIDCYGDTDTRQFSVDFFQVAKLSLAHIEHLVLRAIRQYDIHACLYGSGFERHPDSLWFLQKHLHLFGNTAEIFNFLQDKRRLFPVLNTLDIAYPHVSMTLPDDIAGPWLQKPGRGEGGIGIRFADTHQSQQHCYWQRMIAGEPYSALFLAHHPHCEILGYQRQLISSSHTEPFLFTGVIAVEDDNAFTITRKWAQQLTDKFKLRGLNSLDFIFDGEQCLFLELNPRPSASLQLYNVAVMHAHLACFINHPVKTQSWRESAVAYRIIVAEAETLIESTHHWPDWIVDRPSDGSIIRQGEPICSIIARSHSYRQLATLLHSQRRTFAQIIKKQGNNTNGIHSKR